MICTAVFRGYGAGGGEVLAQDEERKYTICERWNAGHNIYDAAEVTIGTYTFDAAEAVTVNIRRG